MEFKGNKRPLHCFKGGVIPVPTPEEKFEKIKRAMLEIAPQQWCKKSDMLKLKSQLSSYSNRDTAKKVFEHLVENGDIEVVKKPGSPENPRSRLVEYVRRKQ